MERDAPDCGELVGRILRQLSACAVGLWWLESDHLRMLAFESAESVPRASADRFQQATTRVSLSQESLSIVRAAVQGEPSVAVARELPEAEGSGYWLRQFGAARSVAVPLAQGGETRAVLSAAVPQACNLSDDELASALRAGGGGWLGQASS